MSEVQFATQQDVIDYVQAAVDNYDLPSILEKHGVHLKGRGNRFYGACFDRNVHTGKNKSNLSVFMNGGTWFYQCFGCKKTGNVLSFIKEHYNLRNGLEAAMMLREDYEAKPVARAERAVKVNPPLDQDIATIYHKNLNNHPKAVEWWMQQGLTKATMRHFKVGCNPAFPLYDDESEQFKPHHTYTIPVYEYGQLKTIRHRLHGAKGGNKYRPERSGDGAYLFNGDVLDDPLYANDSVLIVAGEKKVMVIWQECGHMMPVVSATAGCTNWFREYGEAWMRRLMHRRVYIGFDPNEINQAEHTAWLFGRHAHLVEFPDNPDDLIISNEDGLSRFWDAIADAKPYRDRALWSI